MLTKKKKEPNMKLQWVKFAVVTILYLLFLYWVESWLGLIVIPFIYDIYITKKIRWQWWKDAESPVTRFLMSWVDAIVFALVAVYFINLFFFQNFVIPSSSLEKSLLVGDYLCVSKVAYGPRIPQTPLTMPLTQHTMPVFGCKSYIEWPQWDYRRVKGLGDIELNDIVVFNYPAGDTLVAEPRYQAADYYQMCYSFGTQLVQPTTHIDSMTTMQQRATFDKIYMAGKSYIEQNPNEFGRIITRPVDRRENYVKRCVGLPGQTLQIKDHIIYLDGKANKEPDNVQYSYNMTLKLGKRIPQEMIDELGITQEDLTQLNQQGNMPMTHRTYEALKARKDIVESIALNTEAIVGDLYPLNARTGWTRDNYGPIWIPKKGQQVPGGLNINNIAIYERPIRVYEGNDLKIENGKILINGKVATNYTFKMDYYWMMGDNRHNSADSRYWGFVPEDHIVGKPLFIWWSSDPDRRGFGGIRWSRLFSWVADIK